MLTALKIFHIKLMKMIFQKNKLKMGSVEDTISVYKMLKQISSYFDMYGTVGYLIKEKETAFCQLSLWAAYIQKMLYFHEIMMNGRRCIIVHGGYIESLDYLEGVKTEDSYE